jgi:hypothetical protein
MYVKQPSGGVGWRGVSGVCVMERAAGGARNLSFRPARERVSAVVVQV